MGSQIWSISITSTTKQQNDDNHHASVTTSPYCAGNSLTSMSGISSFPIVRGPWPTTFILASVAGDKIGLNSQKIHVMIERTLTKNLRAWDRRSGLPGGGKQYKEHARGTRDNVLKYGGDRRRGSFRVCSAAAEGDAFVIYFYNQSTTCAHGHWRLTVPCT
jgi:hypothetical protein